MFGFCRELWWFVVSFRFFGDFIAVSWVFLLVEGSGTVDFLSAKTWTKRGALGAFCGSLVVPKTRLWKVSGGEAGFSTPPFTM